MQKIVRWIGTHGLAVVSKRLTEQTLDFINEEDLKGRIPSPYNEEFVKGLLQAHTCICNRPLVPASAEYSAVMRLLEKAATSELRSGYIRARARISALKEERRDSPAHLREAQREVEDFAGERRRHEQELAELEKQLEGLPLKEINERVEARKAARQRIDDLNRQLGSLDIQIPQLEREIKQKQQEFTHLAARSSKTQRLITRCSLAERGADVLEVFLRNHEEQAREEISAAINNILDRVSHKDYAFTFRDNFALELLYRDGIPVPRSSGENQLMTLAFIAALIQFSMRRSQSAGDHLLIPGTIAPLILDSPFGQLDTKYRVDTARFVPTMASQVVLMVSSSQGDEQVLGALESRIGREYALILESRAPRGNRQHTELLRRGRRIVTSAFNCPKDLTRIERIDKA